MVADIPSECKWELLFLCLMGYSVPISSSSSLYEVLDFPGILFLFLFKTCSCLPILIYCVYMVVGNFLLVMCVVGGVFSVDSCDHSRFLISWLPNC